MSGEIVVCIPSYRRPVVETLAYLPSARVYVSRDEIDAYRAANPPGSDLVEVDPAVQGNLCRIRNHIMETVWAEGDIPCIVDDDLRWIGYWSEDGKGDGVIVDRRLTADQVSGFLERYTSLADQLGVRIWGINVTYDKQVYRQYTPFSLTSYIGGPFAVHLPSDLRYDERLPLKEDYDFTLQHLRTFRRVLRVNRFYYMVRQSEQAGGCATYRSMRAERRQFDLLQRKWGSAIVRYDRTRSGAAGRANVRGLAWDINPVIKPPIAGV